ncbi:hypothetical protein JCM18899A_42760 [Nocardioides sp. AN3]
MVSAPWFRVELLLPPHRWAAGIRQDLPGALAASGSPAALVWVAVEAPSRGWTSPSCLAGHAVGGILLVILARTESLVRESLLQLALLRSHALPSLLLTGISHLLALMPITKLALDNVDDRDAGAASGLLQTTQQLGSSIGLAVGIRPCCPSRSWWRLSVGSAAGLVIRGALGGRGTA